MDYSTLDDVILIRLIARSQADALSELYDRYYRLVFSLALNVIDNHESAEEITLDVFTRVWQNAASYRGDRAKVSTWLTSITRNRAIDEVRRRSARPQQTSLSWAEAPPDGTLRVSGPEATVELALQRRRILSALAQLPQEQRQVLGLAYFKGYTHREIAEAIDKPLGTVKTRIRLGMEKLRRMLSDEMAESL